MELMILFIFSLFVGSFLNVLIDRLPRGEDVIKSRSHCDFCSRTLSWFELIPLLSFILQAGRCRTCRHQLSLQYPLLEVVTALVFVTVGIMTAGIIPIILNCLIASSLIVIFGADLKDQVIPDSMLVMALIAVILRDIYFQIPQGLLLTNLLSGLSAWAFFSALYLITRKRGLGFGDVKLAFVMGFLLGYPGIVVALYAAFLSGAVIGLILILSKIKKLKSKLAFGPFLIWGIIVATLWSTQIISGWLPFLNR